MKSALLLSFIAFCVCLSACKKDEVVVKVSDFQAQKNDISWATTSSWANYSQKDHKFYVNATKRNLKYYQDEQLSFSFEMPDLSNPRTITQFSSKWFCIIGGDGVADSYYLDSSASNQIQITSIDTKKKLIKGSFKVRLVRDSHYSKDGEDFQVITGHFSMEYNEIE